MDFMQLLLLKLLLYGIEARNYCCNANIIRVWIYGLQDVFLLSYLRVPLCFKLTVKRNNYTLFLSKVFLIFLPKIRICINSDYFKF